jgi:hypothetical protein
MPAREPLPDSTASPTADEGQNRDGRAPEQEYVSENEPGRGTEALVRSPN